MTDLRVVGRPLRRIDALPKALGEARYVADISLPRMLHGKILGSPYPHARIINIDTSRARKIPGVKAIVTCDDTSKVRYGPQIPDEQVLATDKVRYVGDQIAAVAAEDAETAEEAVSQVTVEYELLPALCDPDTATADGATLIHQAANNIAAKFEIVRGDVDAAFRKADHVVEDRFDTSLVHQGYIEPIACLASYSPSGKLDVWLPSQRPFHDRALLSKALGIPLSQIKVVNTIIGGAFGAKKYQKAFVIAALLSVKAGRPVRLVYSREMEFASSRPRVPMSIFLRTAVNRDGTLLAKDSKIIADNGAYSHESPGITASAACFVDSLYRYSAVRSIAYLVYTNKIPTGPYRGYGLPQMTYAVESQMDRIAHELRIDPVELRLRNVSQSGDVTIHGHVIQSCGLSDCIRQSAAEVNWEEKRAKKAPLRGIGIACAIHPSGARLPYDYDGSTAIIQAHHDGKFKLLCGEPEMGQGSNTVLAQIAAEVIGTSLEDIEVVPIDTDVVPFGMGSRATRVTFIAGNAVKKAAEDVRNQLVHVAAELLEANPEDIEIRDGSATVKGSPKPAYTLGQLVEAALYRRGGAPVIGKGSYDSATEKADPKTQYGNVSEAYAFAAQVAEVEIDAETGQVQVLDVVAAHDVGKAINPAAAEGQIEGGVVQGIGYALTEEMKVEHGKVMPTTLVDYRMPTMADIPPIRPLLVTSDELAGPFGGKGLGEAALNPTVAAIANAIFHATGIQVKSLPVTPEKMRKVLKNSESKCWE
ncbi:MAG: xanthine dehydrogenase family protein [Chloroflexi bacterium]|nr:xanthine dehydrogenase family protein [Chloroflexota bacterium]